MVMGDGHACMAGQWWWVMIMHGWPMVMGDGCAWLANGGG
jgi:hypothetical protein